MLGGCPITEDEYLENAFKLIPGVRDSPGWRGSVGGSLMTIDYLFWWHQHLRLDGHLWKWSLGAGWKTLATRVYLRKVETKVQCNYSKPSFLYTICTLPFILPWALKLCKGQTVGFPILMSAFLWRKTDHIIVRHEFITQSSSQKFISHRYCSYEWI
jgi:hypothetical protein